MGKTLLNSVSDSNSFLSFCFGDVKKPAQGGLSYRLNVPVTAESATKPTPARYDQWLPPLDAKII
ncbi:hypothetical protein yfred0001_42770 [Yersinia frederiksenii ATCC 33641]|nr:hypothetical protein yfred0001_42770 [Yersinia frederiksenii ATCC 33641]